MPLSLEMLGGEPDFWNSFLNFAKAEIQAESRFENWWKSLETEKLWPSFECLVRLEVDQRTRPCGFKFSSFQVSDYANRDLASIPRITRAPLRTQTCALIIMRAL